MLFSAPDDFHFVYMSAFPSTCFYEEHKWKKQNKKQTQNTSTSFYTLAQKLLYLKMQNVSKSNETDPMTKS